MDPRPLPRHGDRRPYRPDTGADRAEELAARKSLAEGRLALAPRQDGWVEVFEEEGGALIEAPILNPDGEPIAAWDTDALARWMRRDPPARPGLLARLGDGLRRLRP